MQKFLNLFFLMSIVCLCITAQAQKTDKLKTKPFTWQNATIDIPQYWKPTIKPTDTKGSFDLNTEQYVTYDKLGVLFDASDAAKKKTLEDLKKESDEQLKFYANIDEDDFAEATLDTINGKPFLIVKTPPVSIANRPYCYLFILKGKNNETYTYQFSTRVRLFESGSPWDTDMIYNIMGSIRFAK